MPQIKFLWSRAWGVSQFFLGADKGKQSLYRDTLQPFDGAKILDVGCATGNTSSVFCEFDYTGLDIDRDAIAFAAYRFRRFPNVRFICEDLHCHDRPAYYDFIVFASAGHHVPNDELVKILKRCRELIKPGGVIGIFDPVRTGREGAWLRFVMSIDRGKFHKTLDEYAALIAMANLTIKDQKIVTVKGPCTTYTNFAAIRLTI
jgi:SAM-dependent methyltransferase